MKKRNINKKMRFLARIISLLLVVILVSEEFLGSGNIVLAAPQEENSVVEDISAENDAEDPETSEEEVQVLFELEAFREQNSKQFRLSDGTIMAAEYGFDVHYKDEEDEWKEIDNRFLYEPADGTRPEGFATAEGEVTFRFAPDASEHEIVRATAGEYSVGFELVPEAETIPENAAEAAVLEESVETEDGALEESAEMEAGAQAGSAETEPAEESLPITFIRGEILNYDEAAQALMDTPAEASVAALAEGGVSVLAEGLSEDVSQAGETEWMEEWETAPSSDEKTLMEQTAINHAVTSVGYENVMEGVSLQYVASGSSLKEYILVNEKQEDYRYVFALDLEGLVPQMQEDGSILLNDAETGAAVYEIPAAYMTDAAGSYSDAVEMEIFQDTDGSYLLAVEADREWINDEERVFPVQIDPTLNRKFTTTSNLKGTYIQAGSGGTSTNTGNMYVGYDSSGNKEMVTFIRMRNLPELPQNSVICGAKMHFAVMSFSQVACPDLYVCIKKFTDAVTWDTTFSYTSQLDEQLGDAILDYRTINSGKVYTYVGWDITELAKEHYELGNTTDTDVTAFAMRAFGGGSMSNSYCANTALRLTYTSAYPILQIFYRDTRGIEDYYTYQTQSLGYAGTGYVGDYTSQLTLAKTVASYESTIMSYSLGLVYNSANRGSYFSQMGDIHTGNFSTMALGMGWKLTAQETVVPISVEDQGTTETYLVYNDSDGTEHYFKQSDSDSTLYEDEDGLNLTIKKDSSTQYTMTDKKDNQKIFTSGYLTAVKDANGNQVGIVYNNGNGINTSSGNRITSITVQPKDGTADTIFVINYDDSTNLVSGVEDKYGTTYKFVYYQSAAGYQLYEVQRYDNESSATDKYVAEAQYRYNSTGYGLTHAYDAVAQNGVAYEYEQTATGYRICAYHEYAADSIGGTQTTGISIKSSSGDLRCTTYTDSGTDRSFGTSDDILTTYLFNSSGQTVNAESEDMDGNLLGITASAYEESSGTSGKNHRMNSSISSGQAGVNLLLNGGFEKYSDDTAENWTHVVSRDVDAAACRSESPYSGSMHYNLFNADKTGTVSIRQAVSLTAGTAYTFSAYVNSGSAVEFGEDGGACVRILDSSLNVAAEGVILSYKTDEKVDNGWQRLTVTYTPTVSGQYYAALYWQNVWGVLKADDLQLEVGEAATRFNHVDNASFENYLSGWTVSGQAIAIADDKKHRVRSLYAVGTPSTSVCVQQTITLNKSSNTTFLLSGWSKGSSVPDLESEIAGKTDTSLRYWGMTLTLNYSDGTKDEYNLPFSDYVRDWQYAAMAVVPKSADKTISTAALKIYYQGNANIAYFDSISLTEEPAQTYKYDDEGNLVSIHSSGNGEGEYTYDSDTQNLIRIATEGSGDYEYEYNNSNNKHLPTTVKNDSVAMDLTYDAYGQTTKTVLRNTDDDLTMTSTAVYDNGLLSSVTDNTGDAVSYTYDNSRRAYIVTDAAGQATYIGYQNAWDRVYQTYQSGLISINFAYNKGNLTKITRGGYITSGGTKYEQTYNFEHNDFNKVSQISVGSRDLVDYKYNDGNGTLRAVWYGNTTEPMASVTYSYDGLERIKSAVYYDNKSKEKTTWGYSYSSDGNLSGITKDGELVYSYEYDTLERLIHSSVVEDGEIVLYTDHQYDTSDRIVSQSWQIGEDAFEETYTYNNDDGTLIVMNTGGDDLNFGYDSLKRLSSRSSPAFRVNYSYRDIDSTTTTTQIATIQYIDPLTGVTRLPALGYTYDVKGNITKVTSGTSTAAQYTYDAQNQLTQEVRGSYTDSYTYDTYGNIRSISKNVSGIGTATYELSYGNSTWRDLLTKVTYTDYSGNTQSGTLTYDRVGNPLTYFNGDTSWTFTWRFGRQLATATDGTNTITNEYDVDGIRQSKTVNGVEHNYTVLNEKIVRETYGTTTVDYFYDNNGAPYKIVVDEDGTTYTGYYALNSQGDVIAILNSSGTSLVKYTYDAWGNEVGRTYGTTNGGSKLYQYNALKYRGYYYDSDLGFYYLNSRYYDPLIGRFVSADDVSVLSVEQGNLLQYNLYAYCLNNPVNMADDSGSIAFITVAKVICEVGLGVASYMLSSAITGEKITLEGIAVSATASFFGTFGKKLAIVSAVINGVATAVSSYKNGEEFGTALFLGTVSGLASYYSVNTIAEKVSPGIAWGVQMACSATVGLGYDLSVALVTTIIEEFSVDREDSWSGSVKAITVGTREQMKKSGIKKSSRKKSKAPKSRMSTEYFIYLYNGGTPY